MENSKIAIQRQTRKCWYHVDCTNCGGALPCSNSSWSADNCDPDCWQACQRTCATFTRLCMMWNDASIPEEFWGYALDQERESTDFLVESQIAQIRRNISSMVASGVNIAMTSTLPGAGKTYRSILFLKELISEVAQSAYIPNLCLYIHIPTFCYRYELSRALPVEDTRRQEIISKSLSIADARLVVFDGYSDDIVDRPGGSLITSVMRNRQNCKKSSILCIDSEESSTRSFIKHYCDSALQLNLSCVDRRQRSRDNFVAEWLKQ